MKSSGKSADRVLEVAYAPPGELISILNGAGGATAAENNATLAAPRRLRGLVRLGPNALAYLAAAALVAAVLAVLAFGAEVSGLMCTGQRAHGRGSRHSGVVLAKGAADGELSSDENSTTALMTDADDDVDELARQTKSFEPLHCDVGKEPQISTVPPDVSVSHASEEPLPPTLTSGPQALAAASVFNSWYIALSCPLASREEAVIVASVCGVCPVSLFKDAAPLCEEVLPDISIESIALACIAQENWFMQVFLVEEKYCYDFVPSPWRQYVPQVNGNSNGTASLRVDSEAASIVTLVRTSTSTVEVENDPIISQLVSLPESSRLTTQWRVDLTAGCISLFASSMTLDVPFGQRFRIQELYTFCPEREGCSIGTVMRKWCGTHWVEPPPWIPGVQDISLRKVTEVSKRSIPYFVCHIKEFLREARLEATEASYGEALLGEGTPACPNEALCEPNSHNSNIPSSAIDSFKVNFDGCDVKPALTRGDTVDITDWLGEDALDFPPTGNPTRTHVPIPRCSVSPKPRLSVFEFLGEDDVDNADSSSRNIVGSSGAPPSGSVKPIKHRLSLAEFLGEDVPCDNPGDDGKRQLAAAGVDSCAIGKPTPSSNA